ncbi:MAG TPA: cytochrome c biogenesis heme-transporting ATPase CcmA [Gammaproteobacteria bacterium]|nr:cytochrome c biogenesis heme-transporting ATPase CcmA [Gammaproteobacteria bacterium]
MLECASLACMRGDRLLFKELNFELREGELLHVKGINGSGKTSLLRIISALMLAEDGEVRWQGQNIRKLREEYQRDLLYIGHLPGIKGDLTALENLRVNMALGGEEISEEIAWRALGKIGLKGREDLSARVLSQGQQRRVALARMLVSKAKLWVLDEPFTALDVKAVSLLQKVLADHVKNQGMIILTTHQDFTVLDVNVKVLDLNHKGVEV